MIVELITPLMIATAPMTITAAEALKYSHEQQTVEAPSYTVAQRQMTIGGTRTFDMSGRPYDNDND